MTENKRFEVAVYDDDAIGGYSVIDKDRPCHTCRLKYKNVFISTKEGCEIVADLLNELNDENKELRILVDSLKQQNKKFKGRLNDLGVEYYD